MLNALVDAEDIHTIIEILEKEQVGLWVINILIKSLLYFSKWIGRSQRVVDGGNLSILGCDVRRLEGVKSERVVARFGDKKSDRVDLPMGEDGCTTSKCFTAFAWNGEELHQIMFCQKNKCCYLNQPDDVAATVFLSICRIGVPMSHPVPTEMFIRLRRRVPALDLQSLSLFCTAMRVPANSQSEPDSHTNTSGSLCVVLVVLILRMNVSLWLISSSALWLLIALTADRDTEFQSACHALLKGSMP